MIKHLIRAFIGHWHPPKTPYLDYLKGEWRNFGPDKSNRSWYKNNGDGTGTAHAVCVLGPLLPWVHPPKSWKQPALRLSYPATSAAAGR